ncbi:MAG: dihydropteroate synthase [Dokdonella sp.]|nr:dihydropteroate synthase [Dokdonella sp.]
MFAITLDCNGRDLVLDRPRIAGVLNVTPDSFSDGGRWTDPGQAVEHALRLIEEGADLIDVGGESTRPGAEPVPAAEEIARVVPVIAALRERTSVPISIDTSKPEVMRAAVEAGAGLINDVAALRGDGALDAAAALGVPVCLMHMRGEPRTMQAAPEYDDVVGEVHRFLAERLFACQMAGIDKKRILVDPGFGFGKTLEHNLALLRDLGRFAELAPVYVGLSRKTMIGALTGRDDPAARAAGSAAAALIAVQRGALLVRVHDVAVTRDALAVWAGVAVGDKPRAVNVATARAPRTPWDED